MKLGFVQRSTTFCVVILSIAFVCMVSGWMIMSPMESIGLSIIAALLALWGLMAWPHDTMYSVTVQKADGTEAKVITALPAKWDRSMCLAYLALHVKGSVQDIDPIADILHCPMRLQNIGHY